MLETRTFYIMLTDYYIFFGTDGAAITNIKMTSVKEKAQRVFCCITKQVLQLHDDPTSWPLGTPEVTSLDLFF